MKIGRGWYGPLTSSHESNTLCFEIKTDTFLLSTSYNTMWKDVCPGKKKQVVLTLKKMLHPIHILEDSPLVVSTLKQHVKHGIGVVYFANLFAARSIDLGLELCVLQMIALVDTGLVQDTQCVFLDLVVCGPSERFDDVQTLLCLHIPSILKEKIHIVYVNENRHEYPGIHRVWTRSHEVFVSIMLYFHSKGITRYIGGSRRDAIERKCFDIVIQPWRHILDVFETFPTIDKIGPTCSAHGWIWHNFFWARTSYLQCVEEPIQTSRRHYYEDWLARKLRHHRSVSTQSVTEHSYHDKDMYNCTYLNCFNLLYRPGQTCHIGSCHQPRQSLSGQSFV